MTYQVIFDATESHYTSQPALLLSGHAHWRQLALSLLVFLVALAVLIFRKRLNVWWARPRTAPRIIYGAFGVTALWAGISLWLYYAQNPTWTVRVRSLQPKTVEGRVHDFVPMPFGGHANEHFCVETTCFHYSDYLHMGGFNNTSSHGGPIREGLPVRITYVEDSGDTGNLIVKLEIGTDGAPSEPGPDAERAKAIAERAYLDATEHEVTQYRIQSFGRDGSKWTFSVNEVENGKPSRNWEVDVDVGTGRANVIGRD